MSDKLEDDFVGALEETTPNYNAENVILNKSINFSLGIITFCEELEAKKKYVISNQLLKSGTSIGANVKEAQHAESRSDFIHKLKIASKEAAETEYWLFLCKMAEAYPDPGELFDQVIAIQKLLGRIISTSKTNLKSLNN